MAGDQDRSAQRFRRDVGWNVVSLVFLAGSGIALNALIGLHWDAAALGAFNQVLAAYVFFSQAAAGGVHLSVLRSVSAGERRSTPAVLLGALIPTALIATPVCAAFALAAEPLGRLLQSEAVAPGMLAATPGLLCFAFNKVLLGAVNGLRRMRTFAVLQALRYVLILCGLLVLIAVEAPAERLPFVFTFAEGLLLVVLLVEVSLRAAWWRGAGWRPWAVRHVGYGMRGFLSGMLLELNSRVDVLMLGWLLDDAEVGVYSFAALFAEGFFQLVVVLQNNYNPLLAEHLGAGRLRELEALVRRGRPRRVLVMAALGLAAVAVYPLVLAFLTDEPAFGRSLAPFALLVAGIALASGDLPFFHLLSMGDRPGWHSAFLAAVVLTNVVGNLLCIPVLGIDGAALATAVSFLASVVMLRVSSRRLLALRL